VQTLLKRFDNMIRIIKVYIDVVVLVRGCMPPLDFKNETAF
jgi:hypothetical protein